MADSPYSFFGDAVSWINQKIIQIDPTNTVKTLENLLFSTDTSFAYDVFPEDLGSEQLNQYMILRMYTPGNVVQPNSGPLNTTGFTQNNYNVGLFMPSETGSGGAFPIFTDTHEYADIFMSNIFMNQIAGSKATNFVKGAAATTGRVINPGVQVLYKTTMLREFDFAFLFAPRSQAESESMKRIIRKIREYAAPKDEGWFYRSPAEVEIEFRFNGAVNPHIIKMKRQVIKSIDVNFAPQGTFSTFTNGHPVACMLTMRTKEMEIIDRDDIRAGY